MAQAVEPERRASSVTFEVERFEAQGRDRMFLSGRWFGLRGRRFVRPTLTIGADGNRQRALADLEHKPWAARDGERWQATFPYERAGDDFGTIELTVAPDVTVTLPAPGSGAAEQRLRARRRSDDFLDNLRGARRATRWEDGSEAQREASRVPQTPPPVGADGSDGAVPQRSDGAGPRRSDRSPDLVRRLSQSQQEIERLRSELARYESARVEAVSAMTREDAAVSRLTDAIAARDKAVEARAQAVRARDQAVRARDQAVRERDRMAGQRDQAMRERDRATAKAKRLSEAAATHRSHTTGPTATPSRAETSEGFMWAQRILAVSVLVIAVLAFAITARLL